MNVSVLLLAFCLAVITGAIAATMLARIRPAWSERRRLLTAAAILPALTMAAALIAALAVLASENRGGGDMRDLAIAAIGSIGAASAMLAFVGGLIGAGLRQRGMRR